MSEKFNFEASLAQLEGLVAAMESGDLSLEESMKAFEEGVVLTRECHQALDQAEQKVQILMQDAKGKLVEKPFSKADSPQEIQ